MTSLLATRRLAVALAHRCTGFQQHGLLPAGKHFACSCAATKQGRKTTAVPWKLSARPCADAATAWIRLFFEKGTFRFAETAVLQPRHHPDLQWQLSPNGNARAAAAIYLGSPTRVWRGRYEQSDGYRGK